MNTTPLAVLVGALAIALFAASASSSPAKGRGAHLSASPKPALERVSAAAPLAVASPACDPAAKLFGPGRGARG